jgi:hypothetical protein
MRYTLDINIEEGLVRIAEESGDDLAVFSFETNDGLRLALQSAATTVAEDFLKSAGDTGEVR